MNGITGIRGLAQAFLRSAAMEGLTATTAIEQLSASGLGTYRRQTMLADFRNYKDMPMKAAQLYNVAYDRRPSKTLYTENLGRQFSRYKYQIDITAVSRTTGQEITMSTNVTSDSPLTRRQAEGGGVDALLGALDQSEYDITDDRLAVAFHRYGDEYD